MEGLVPALKLGLIVIRGSTLNSTLSLMAIYPVQLYCAVHSNLLTVLCCTLCPAVHCKLYTAHYTTVAITSSFTYSVISFTLHLWQR